MNKSTNEVQTRPNIKVTDPRYGLRTAARIAHQRRLAEEFKQSRREALEKDRSRVQSKLDSLRSEIRKVFARLETGVIQEPVDVNQAFLKLERMGACERKFESDITRITEKIGAI